MAIDAKTHGEVDFSLGHRLLLHVAVANRAIHSCANVRRMIEFQVDGGLKIIDALPGDVLASRFVASQPLDFRFIGGDHLVAGHTKIDTRNTRVRPLINPDMALRALHAVRQMYFVGVRDWLDRV